MLIGRSYCPCTGGRRRPKGSAWTAVVCRRCHPRGTLAHHPLRPRAASSPLTAFGVTTSAPTHTCARRAATRQQRPRRAHDERNLSRPSLSWRELAIHLVGCGHRKGSTRHRTQAGWTAGVAYFTYPLRKVGGFRVSAPATPSTRGPQILGSSSKSNTRRCFQR